MSVVAFHGVAAEVLAIGAAVQVEVDTSTGRCVVRALRVEDLRKQVEAEVARALDPIMAWRCDACSGECAEEARPYMDRCHGDGPHTWKRIMRGKCSDCNAAIYVGEEYAMVVRGREVVRGRIGQPSDMVTGVTRGHDVYRCGGCLRTEGPLER